MNFKAVILDLDGVIVSTDTLHYHAWKRLSDDLNVYFDSKINDQLRGVSRSESLSIILENSQIRYTAEERKKLADRKNQYYREMLKKLTPNDILPDVTETLESLKQRKLLLGIASSSKNAGIILEKIGLMHSFDAVCDGNSITKSKPDPEVFCRAAEMLHVCCKDCLAVDDAIAGVQAARAANMKVAAIGSSCGFGEADFDLSEFTQILSLCSK